MEKATQVDRILAIMGWRMLLEKQAQERAILLANQEEEREIHYRANKEVLDACTQEDLNTFFPGGGR